MSVISNIHTAQIYDAKQSKPFDGQRLVVTIAKKDKDGNYGPNLQQTQCTSIPVLTVAEIDFTSSTIQNICIDYFKTIQNSIISDNIKDGKKTITTDEISQDAIVTYLFSESAGEKWDASRIASWFTDNVATAFLEKLIENGVSENELEKKLEVTTKRFSESLGSKAKIPALVAEKLTQVLKLAESNCKGDAMYTRFYNRLNPPAAAEMLDFGF